VVLISIKAPDPVCGKLNRFPRLSESDIFRSFQPPLSCPPPPGYVLSHPHL